MNFFFSKQTFKDVFYFVETANRLSAGVSKRKMNYYHKIQIAKNFVDSSFIWNNRTPFSFKLVNKVCRLSIYRVYTGWLERERVI